MLIELKRYLAERKSVTLKDLSIRFAMDAQALRPMLDHWIRKGKLQRSAPAQCGHCVSCAPEDLETYVWLESAEPQRTGAEHADETCGHGHARVSCGLP